MTPDPAERIRARRRKIATDHYRLFDRRQRLLPPTEITEAY